MENAREDTETISVVLPIDLYERFCKIARVGQPKARGKGFRTRSEAGRIAILYFVERVERERASQ
jgi:hypothetical protein